MKKVFFLSKLLIVVCLLTLTVQPLKAQCDLVSPETYFIYGLEDVNHPISTGVTSGLISLQRITPVNPNDPIPTRKFISVYATNWNTSDTYSAYVEDYGDDNIFAEFSYNQDDYDDVIYSWEVEYSNLPNEPGQIKTCHYDLTSFRASLTKPDMQEKLKTGSAGKLPFSRSLTAMPRNENLIVAKTMRTQLINNNGSVLVRLN